MHARSPDPSFVAEHQRKPIASCLDSGWAHVGHRWVPEPVSVSRARARARARAEGASGISSPYRPAIGPNAERQGPPTNVSGIHGTPTIRARRTPPRLSGLSTTRRCGLIRPALIQSADHLLSTALRVVTVRPSPLKRGRETSHPGLMSDLRHQAGCGYARGPVAEGSIPIAELAAHTSPT